MNLHVVASQATGAINPITTATLSLCTGATTSPDGHRIATYATPTPVRVDAQELSSGELMLANNLNLVGIMKKFYSKVQLKAGDRESGTGGDILIWYGDTWLVVHVIESYPQGGWCSVIGQKQVTP